MKEISLHILDIAQNSVRAGATRIVISLVEKDSSLTFTVEDDGCGMPAELLASVTDPFTTTRTTRKVGLGIPLLIMAARQTGGEVSISSQTGEHHGTVLTARFCLDHIDCMPLGDMTETVVTLIQGAPDIDWVYSHVGGGYHVSLSTPDIRAVLGNGISLADPEILQWIRSSLSAEYQN